jgi:protein phosphatase
MAIGASSPLAVHYYPVPLSPGAVVLMCSDGLHGVVDDAHIEEILRQAGDSVPLMESCQRLIDAAKEAGGPDNVTTVLLRKPV